MLKVLESFHQRVARRLTGKIPYRHNGECEHPPIKEALDAASMHSMDHYIMVRQRTLVQNIATRPILGLCREMEKLSGSVNRQDWWDQQQIKDLLEGTGEEGE